LALDSYFITKMKATELYKSCLTTGFSQTDALKFVETARRYKKSCLKIQKQKEKRAIQVLDKPPKFTPNVATTKKCQARTMEGRACPFKAHCGDYCKKHAA